MKVNVVEIIVFLLTKTLYNRNITCNKFED